MNNRFLKVDIKAVTFCGLSKSLDRKLALLNSVLIWLSISLVLIYLASSIGPNGVVGFVTLFVMSLSVLDYIFNGRFIPHSLAKAVASYMPISVLYRKDMQVINAAKKELLALTSQVRFEDYLVYAKINPDIRSRECILIMMAQRKGKLNQWTKHPKHLKKLANLVYQIYLVEQFLHDDMDRF